MVVVDAYVGVALDGRVDMLVFMLMFDVVVASANVFDDGNFCSSYTQLRESGGRIG